MPNKNNEYYYIDINLSTREFVDAGFSNTAKLHEKPDEDGVYRLYLTKGQYNKLMKHLNI